MRLSHEYPGGYEHRNAQGQTLAQVRRQAMDARFLSVRGRRGNCTPIYPQLSIRAQGSCHRADDRWTALTP